MQQIILFLFYEGLFYVSNLFTFSFSKEEFMTAFFKEHSEDFLENLSLFFKLYKKEIFFAFILAFCYEYFGKHCFKSCHTYIELLPNEYIPTIFFRFDQVEYYYVFTFLYWSVSYTIKKNHSFLQLFFIVSTILVFNDVAYLSNNLDYYSPYNYSNFPFDNRSAFRYNLPFYICILPAIAIFYFFSRIIQFFIFYVQNLR